jgi:hypothetical protein
VKGRCEGNVRYPMNYYAKDFSGELKWTSSYVVHANKTRINNRTNNGNNI